MPNHHDVTGLDSLGILPAGAVTRNLPTNILCEEALRRGEGQLASGGALVVVTGRYTGRLPQDKFFVREASSEKRIDWGTVNRPFEEKRFDPLLSKMAAYLSQKDLFIQDHFAGADPEHRIAVRVITEKASAALFARTILLRNPENQPSSAFIPGLTIVHAPDFRADPVADGTRSEAFILMHLGRGLVLIGGTLYAGEIKKSIFSYLNYLLPQKNVLPMHCSANYGKNPEDAAIFFGLSGTGKTTLSASPDRVLVGDDEHGWSSRGIFNFEGGCYAKVIRLSAEGEPEIYASSGRSGTLLENVVLDPKTKVPDFDDDSLTENTRATYPLDFIPHATFGGLCGHPRHIFMLTCDAFGVLPPVAKLSRDQAMYHFIAGYTAKIAGTESGIKEPQATFSPCFGGPFMPQPPSVYAKMLGEKIDQHKASVWLVNTGWSGGSYGEGRRMKLDLTRAIVKAILQDRLNEVPVRSDAVFGLRVPISCPGIPAEILNPRSTWKDASAYDRKAAELAGMFHKHFLDQCGSDFRELESAGPKVS